MTENKEVHHREDCDREALVYAIQKKLKAWITAQTPQRGRPGSHRLWRHIKARPLYDRENKTSSRARRRDPETLYLW